VKKSQASIAPPALARTPPRLGWLGEEWARCDAGGGLPTRSKERAERPSWPAPRGFGGIPRSGSLLPDEGPDKRCTLESPAVQAAGAGRSTSVAPVLDAIAWAFAGDLVNNTPLQFLAAGYADPHTLRRLGRARLIKFLWRYSHGAWGESHASTLMAAADETLKLWNDEIEFGDLADDIAVEARLALQLSKEIHELDERIAVLLQERDPAGIMASAPGVGKVNAAQILARLGDPNRFQSLAGARSFSGLVPSLDASGVNGHHGSPTKSGDAPLREALFMAAGWARRVDPTLAARYHRLMVKEGKHHNSALCHLSTVLLTRMIACWRSGTPYVIRDVDGTPITAAEGRAIVSERYRVSEDIRALRRTTHKQRGTGRRSKESPGAPSTSPSRDQARTPQVA
jgi:hypothetical protein